MSGSPAPSTPAAPAPRPVDTGASLRAGGVVVLVLVLVEILVGNQLALAGSPYPLAYLAGHIALAVIVSGFAAHVLLRAVRRRHAPVRAAAAITFVAAVGATLGGTWFLVGGMTNPALYAMEGLGGLALLGALLVIVWGGARPSTAPTAP